MLKLRVLTSFTYRYQDKVHYFRAGDYYHLFGKKDAEEIVYILSPGSEYRKYFYIVPGSIGLEDVAPDSEIPLESTESYTKEQLQEMHYTKIQDIAEGLGIDYSTKAETIEKILELQFQTVS